MKESKSITPEEQLKLEVSSQVDKNLRFRLSTGNHVTSSFHPIDNSMKEKVRVGLQKLVTNLKNFRKDFGGYSVSFSKYFNHPDADLDPELFEAPFLAITNPEGEQVGVLRFKIGFPMVISELQGVRGNLPADFYKATGRYFDEALIDSFIELVSRSLPFHTPPNLPKVIFSKKGFNDIKSQATRRRLISRYFPKHALNNEISRMRIRRGMAEDEAMDRRLGMQEYKKILTRRKKTMLDASPTLGMADRHFKKFRPHIKGRRPV